MLLFVPLGVKKKAGGLVGAERLDGGLAGRAAAQLNSAALLVLVRQVTYDTMIWYDTIRGLVMYCTYFFLYILLYIALYFYFGCLLAWLGWTFFFFFFFRCGVELYILL